MSKFFQTSLKKEKNLLESNSNDKNEKRKHVEIENKKKNTKKFVMSPIKEIPKEINTCTNNSPKINKYENEHIFQIIHNESNENINNDEDMLINNENSSCKSNFSFMYNKCVSPLYTNTNVDVNKKSILSSLCYEPIDNTNKNNYNDEYNYNNPKINNEVIEKEKSEKNSNCTSINKLNFTSLNNEPTLTYIQKDKFKLYNYNVMLDTKSHKFINCDNNIPCYYCRRKYNFVPLGIPIKYYPSLYILIDNSLQISKYSFNYKENTIRLNKNEKDRIVNILQNNPNIVSEKYERETKEKEQKKEHKIFTKNFFETDGIVCSFNCMISFIEENSYNPIYQNSYNYVYLMYKQIFGEYPHQPIIRAPSWKLRKEYGGTLDDEDYSKFIQSVPIIESKLFKTINTNIKPEIVFEVLV
jgi:hypothetical protein